MGFYTAIVFDKYPLYSVILYEIDLKQRKQPSIRLDAIDHRILAALVENGRLSTIDIAERVGLSPTPCGRRIRRLEDSGVIQGYTARLNPAALGMNVCVIVTVKLRRQDPDGHSQFLKVVESRPEISECLLVTGSSDYLLRIWVQDIDDLASFIPATLQGVPAVAETSTMLVIKHVGGAVLAPSKWLGRGD
jgi:Lrp/AsnC family leucine-responsive transcriptional regulator